MDLIQFNNSLTDAAPPPALTALQTALWHAAKGEWDAAHDIAQQYEGQKEFDRLHAYLHRVEGDNWNAAYWYKRAGATMPGKSIEEELKDLIKEWLG
ncbi:hypothetical protein [Niabella aquatica]